MPPPPGAPARSAAPSRASPAVPAPPGAPAQPASPSRASPAVPAPLGSGVGPASAWFRSCRSYEQVPAVDGEDGAGDERRGVRGEELVGAGEVGGAAPPPLGGVLEDPRGQLRVGL